MGASGRRAILIFDTIIEIVQARGLAIAIAIAGSDDGCIDVSSTAALVSMDDCFEASNLDAQLAAQLAASPTLAVATVNQLAGLVGAACRNVGSEWDLGPAAVGGCWRPLEEAAQANGSVAQGHSEALERVANPNASIIGHDLTPRTGSVSPGRRGELHGRGGQGFQCVCCFAMVHKPPERERTRDEWNDNDGANRNDRRRNEEDEAAIEEERRNWPRTIRRSRGPFIPPAERDQEAST
ncbi:hypothetical protein ACJZ2D_003850 [Fusarium nematophilum]